ncbi:14432_t:CDS:2 [Cetraspora pellucida]|uniref:14432_t:CDS:1 n=1 Tax=Cetraspora pellucida TaxID=1433469 RepID=A0A9N9GLV7_9GLOM|nr:14432_t:CDS:2 [Cetraspora pellucida]
MANVYTFQNIKGHRLGSIREEELEKKIHNAIKSKAEINKLKIQKLHTHALQVINEHKQIQNENTNLISHNTQKDIFIAESKAENVTKSKKIKSLEFIIKILESKLSLAQKDVISIQNDSLKKESEILSLKSKIIELEQELALMVSKLRYLKSENKSKLVVGGNNEKNMQSEEQSSIIKSGDISAISEPIKNLSKYFIRKKSMDQTEKIDSNISDHIDYENTPISEESMIQSYIPTPKVDAENSTKLSDDINISGTKNNKIITPL